MAWNRYWKNSPTIYGNTCLRLGHTRKLFMLTFHVPSKLSYRRSLVNGTYSNSSEWKQEIIASQREIIVLGFTVGKLVRENKGLHNSPFSYIRTIAVHFLVRFTVSYSNPCNKVFESLRKSSIPLRKWNDKLFDSFFLFSRPDAFASNYAGK